MGVIASKRAYLLKHFTNMLTNMQKFFSRLFPKRKEKIEIIIKTNESWELHLSQKTKMKFCPECKTETVFVPGDLGTQIVQKDAKTISDLISNGSLHISSSPDSKSFICMRSLNKEFAENESRMKDVGGNR